MSSQSQLSCANLALLSIGARTQISSLSPSDGSTASDAASTLFTFVFELYARSARWGCLKKQVALTLLQAAQGTPENPTGTTLPLPQQSWSYAYLYPSDCLFFRQVLCPNITSSSGATPQTSVNNSVASWVPGDGAIPYEIAYTVDANNNPLTVILTNQQQAIGNYTVNQPNPQLWDSLFTAGFVAALAVYLAPALNLNTPLMAQCKQQAESMIAIARAQDGNEGTTSQDHSPDWIRARQGATGFAWYGPKYNAYGYISMIWPG